MKAEDLDPVGILAGRPERTIAFEAVFNFRDLGGYPAAPGRAVRWRRLFRADGLHRLRPDEGEQFRLLGIATVVDLRTESEVRSRGAFPAEVAAVDYHHLPMFDAEPDWEAVDPRAAGYLADRYVEMLDVGRAALRGTVELLARPEAYPLVFHCAAGKDRTGITAAVVLALLGVPDEVIADDYALSHEAMARLTAWGLRNEPSIQERLASYPAAVLGAEAETMTGFLERVRDRHGSVEGLVAGLGVPADTVAALRANLLT